MPDQTLDPEIYRQVFVTLDIPLSARPVIGVTSAIRGEGRTTVALGLAQSLAGDLDTTILLVDADFGNPSLARRFGIPASPGLQQVVEGDAELEDVSFPVSDQLSVITTGDVEPDATRFLRDFAVQNPFQHRRRPAGVVIVDLPPVLAHSYSPLAAAVTDAVVLVVRAGVTPADLVREAVERLADSPPRGIVLNGAQSSLPNWWPA